MLYVEWIKFLLMENGNEQMVGFEILILSEKFQTMLWPDAGSIGLAAAQDFPVLQSASPPLPTPLVLARSIYVFTSCCRPCRR